MLLASGYHWWLPIDISTHGSQIDTLIELVHWFMAALFVGWGIFFVYCLYRFRSRPGHVASAKLPKAKASKYSEALVVIIEVLLLGFSVPIWAHVRGAGHAPAPGNALEVRVVAQQFAWNIHYPGRDGKFGQSHIDRISEENPIGLDRSEPEAKDDIFTINRLHVPVDKDVLVHLTSMDVIHSFGIPLLRIKQDVIPGMSIPVWFKATRTTDEVREEMTETYSIRPGRASIPKNYVMMNEYKTAGGTVIVGEGDDLTEEVVDSLTAAGITQIRAAPDHPTEIACAQLCGNGHYRMRGYLHVDSEGQFDKWLAQEEERLAEEEEYDEY